MSEPGSSTSVWRRRGPALLLLVAAACAPVASGQVVGEGGEAPAEPEAIPARQPFFKMDLWDAYAELGINGSSGNNERFNLIALTGASRTTVHQETKADLIYSYATDDGDESENQFLARAGHTWLLPESKWRYYIRGLFEYDEFQNWDYRIRLSTGVGYEVINNDQTLFVLRAGPSVLREFGGSDNSWIPEGNVGYDFEHNFNERTALTSVFDFYSDLSDLDEFRIEFSAGLKVDVSDNGGLYLSLGVLDRYDSDPGEGFDRNDLDYFVTLGAKF